MSLSKVIEVARGELGQTENPAGSNLTKYGFWYGVDGVPWCVIFLCWLFNQAGERMAFFGGGQTASCSILLRWYREQGLTVPVEDVQVGDIVLLNFRGGKDPEHCGLVELVNYADSVKNMCVWTIEGNTTPGYEGSQDNGGCVASKMRFGSQIVGVCRPQYQPEPEIVDDITGHWAEDAIRWCMEHGLMQGYPDGSFQPDRPVTRAELAAVIRRLMEM
jgi:S-layer homology domain.